MPQPRYCTGATNAGDFIGNGDQHVHAMERADTAA